MAEISDEELIKMYKTDPDFRTYCQNMYDFFLRAQWANVIYKDQYIDEDIVKSLRLNAQYFDKEKGLDVFLEEPWLNILSGKAGICKLITQYQTEKGFEPESMQQLCNSKVFEQLIKETEEQTLGNFVRDSPEHRQATANAIIQKMFYPQQETIQPLTDATV